MSISLLEICKIAKNHFWTTVQKRFFEKMCNDMITQVNLGLEVRLYQNPSQNDSVIEFSFRVCEIVFFMRNRTLSTNGHGVVLTGFQPLAMLLLHCDCCPSILPCMCIDSYLFFNSTCPFSFLELLLNIVGILLEN